MPKRSLKKTLINNLTPRSCDSSQEQLEENRHQTGQVSQTSRSQDSFQENLHENNQVSARPTRAAKVRCSQNLTNIIRAERSYDLDVSRERASQRVAAENDEQRERRLQDLRQRAAQRVATENDEQRERRLQDLRLRAVQRVASMADFHTPAKDCLKKKSESEIKIPASPFLTKLGYGTGVSVLKLTRSPSNGQVRSPWAVKMINKNIKKTTIFGKRLQEEAKLLKEMSHPNIVGFRFAKTRVGRLCLGMETCDGSLGDQIEKRLEEDQPPYPPQVILKVALDIGKALDYIHTKVKILHGDIKSYNVLVNGNFEICKLCDFGVSLPLNENGIVPVSGDGTNYQYVGTELWSAPEIFTPGYLISSKADMFSYGLCLWEMMALTPPHIEEEGDLDQSVVCLDDKALPTACGTRPLVPSHLDTSAYELPLALFYSVTEATPAARPDASHAVLCAEDMLARYADVQYKGAMSYFR